jgi:hypothetical protein
VCVSEDLGHGEGEGAHATLLTDTRRRVVSHAENAGRMPGVELREPRNLCACVSEECGHGEGAGAPATLLTDTRRRVVSLVENAGRIPGAPVCVCDQGGWGQGGSGGGWGRIKCTIVNRSCRIRRVCIVCKNVRGS